MSKGTPYISPEYNPHALQRDWGFLICEQHPEIIEAFSGSLSDLRARLHESSVGKFAQNDANAPLTAGAPAKVTTDGLAANRSSLYDEVGLDILTLALLSDVPAHRSLHLTQNSLIGHWRWLRDVWRVGYSRPQFTATMDTRNAVTEVLRNGKNNLAIAELRNLLSGLEDMNKEVEQALGGDGQSKEKEGVDAVPDLTAALFLAPQIIAQALIFIGTLLFFLMTRKGIYSWLSRHIGDDEDTDTPNIC